MIHTGKIILFSESPDCIYSSKQTGDRQISYEKERSWSTEQKEFEPNVVKLLWVVKIEKVSSWLFKHWDRDLTKSSSDVYISTQIYIAKFGLVWFYGISTIVSYLIPNPLYTYILNIYDLVWLGFMTSQPL